MENFDFFTSDEPSHSMLRSALKLEPKRCNGLLAIRTITIFVHISRSVIVVVGGGGMAKGSLILVAKRWKCCWENKDRFLIP